jgi:hypothetical protein
MLGIHCNSVSLLPFSPVSYAINFCGLSAIRSTATA